VCPPVGTVAVSVVDEDTETPVAFNVAKFPDVGISWTVVALRTNPIPVIVTNCDPADVGLTPARNRCERHEGEYGIRVCGAGPTDRKGGCSDVVGGVLADGGRGRGD